jgi:hypothetical protein
MPTLAALRRPLPRRLALCCGTILATAMPALARAADPPVIVVGEPEGFANLTSERTVLVDVYFGGQRRGEAQIEVVPGSVTLVDPRAVPDLLPAVTDRALVETALGAGHLAANSELVCTPGADPRRCGRLAPATVGVIYDREKFRLDVFLNPQLVAVQENVEEQYLPAAQGGPSLVNSLGAVLSGRSGAGGGYYNVFDQLVLAHGERRLRAEVSYATGLGLETERLAFEWDRPGLRYSAGALWAPGSEIAGRRKLIGVGVETQIDTRLDKDEILGSPVVVYLDQRSRVDVVRDGRVLNSAIYEAGNQQVDTSSLPDGSYDIVLRIVEPGRPAREERRFFTKSRRIPSPGRTDFFAYGGMLVEDIHRGSLEPSSHPYVQASVARRLSESWALAGGIEATDEGASAELSTTLLTPLAQIRAAAVADLDGGYGGIVQLASAGTSRLSFNFDIRRIERAGDDAAPVAPPAPGNPFGVPDLVGPGGSYSQLGGIVSYSRVNLRFLGTVFYRDDEDEAARYSIGPAVEWDFLRKGKLTLTLRGDFAATERGNSGFAGVSLRLLGASTTVTALGGARASGIPNDDLGEGPVAALAGSWNPQVGGGDLSLGAGLEHQPRQDNLIVSSEFRHPLGSLSGDVVRSDGPGAAVTQYSLGLQTTFIAGAGAVQVAGKTTTESMIVAQVDGAREGETFDVLVNEQVAGSIDGARPLALALPAYRAYAVRIRPTGAALLAYDNSARSVGLYPGSVTRLEWRVAPVVIKVGRLVSPDGVPVRGASITGQGIWSETDDEGYFQIEAPDDAELTVTLPDGSSFTTTLPAGEATDGIARIGAVVCCGRREVRLGALDVPEPAFRSDPQ